MLRKSDHINSIFGFHRLVTPSLDLLLAVVLYLVEDLYANRPPTYHASATAELNDLGRSSRQPVQQPQDPPWKPVQSRELRV